MYKKVLCAAFAAALLFSACSGKPSASSSAASSESGKEVPSVAASSAVSSSASSSSAPTAEKQDDFSALPQDLQPVFDKARTLYDFFYLRAPEHDKANTVTINGQDFWLVTDARFTTYEAFVNELYSVFTADFVDTELLESGLYETIEGKLYTSVVDRTPNTTFHHAEIATVQPSETEVGFTVAAHYEDSDLPAAEQESIKTFGFHAVKSETGWQFDQFDIYR